MNPSFCVQREREREIEVFVPGLSRVCFAAGVQCVGSAQWESGFYGVGGHGIFRVIPFWLFGKYLFRN